MRDLAKEKANEEAARNFSIADEAKELRKAQGGNVVTKKRSLPKSKRVILTKETRPCLVQLHVRFQFFINNTSLTLTIQVEITADRPGTAVIYQRHQHADADVRTLQPSQRLRRYVVVNLCLLGAKPSVLKKRKDTEVNIPHI